jgi:Flp pilus assembly protein TadG
MRHHSGFSGRRNERGQVMVFAVLFFVAMLAMTGLIIDGGNAFVQQRGAQNGSDAAALAGATVMVQNMGGAPRTDADVVAAVEASLASNGTTLSEATYVNWAGATVGTVGQGGAIPSTAAGVHVAGTRSFGTYVAGVIGITSLTVSADATAVAGTLSGGPALPVVFSVNISDCAGNGEIMIGSNAWPTLSLADAKADVGVGQHEAIVPLCKTGPGGVGWIETGCPGNLQQQIDNPCDVSWDIPTWLRTSPGNPNNIDLSNWDGKIVLIPLFDGTCRSKPSSGALADCTDPGNGTNLWYHIPYFVAMLVDHSYIQGNNNPECNHAPGSPPAGGNGSNGCVKGWFIEYVYSGPVTPYTGGGNPSVLGVQLIH